METIFRGYDFNVDVSFNDGSDASNLSVRLFSPSTHISANPTSWGENEENGITCEFSASLTMLLPVGIYSLEVYDGDTIIDRIENYARCVEASPADGFEVKE